MDPVTLQGLVEIGTPLAGSAVSGITTALFSTLYLRKNIQMQELEKLKALEYKEILDKLLNDGKISHVEYYKANNYLKVAKLADKKAKQERRRGEQVSYDFDWFLRFFESASNVSNEDMQKLWATILAGEVTNPGSFSLRTLDTVYNMSQNEAMIFLEATKIIIDDSFFFSAMGDVGQEINEQYGYNNDVLRLLEEIGLVNGLRMESALELNPGESGGFTNGKHLLLFTPKGEESISLRYTCYNLTLVGHQLYSAVHEDIEDYSYLYELGKAIQNKYPSLKVSLHPTSGADEDVVSYEPTIDYLSK